MGIIWSQRNSRATIHVGNHYDIVKQHMPKSIEQLAMILAMIRPGKRYLVGNEWSVIEKEVWQKTDDYSLKEVSNRICNINSCTIKFNS